MQRTRTKNEVVISAVGSYSTTLCNGTVSSVAQNGPRAGSLVTTSDVVTRNFNKLRDSGVVLNNPYSSHRVVFTSGGSHAREFTRSAACSGTSLKKEKHDFLLTAATGQLSTTTPVGLIDDSSAQTSTLTAAYAGVALPDVQGLVELAELRKTLEMLRHPLESMRKYVTRAKRSKNDHFGDHAGAIAGTWLELRYGWFPLMLTVEGVVKALNRKVQERYNSRDSVTLSVGPSTTAKTFVDAYNNMGYDEIVTEQRVIRSGVLYSHDLAALTGDLGLSLSDIPSSMWELLPYSFVVDWFVNVGDLVNALTPRAGTNVLAAWTSCHRTTTLKRVVTSIAPGASLSGFNVTTSNVGAWVQAVYSDNWRQPRGRADIGLTLTLSLSDLHVKDLIALLLQRIR